MNDAMRHFYKNRGKDLCILESRCYILEKSAETYPAIIDWWELLWYIDLETETSVGIIETNHVVVSGPSEINDSS